MTPTVTDPGSWQPDPRGLGIANPLDYPPAPDGAVTGLSAATVESALSAPMTAASPPNGGSFAVASGTGFEIPATDDLDGAVGAADTSLVLTDASGFPNAGVASVESERFSWNAKDGNTLLGVVRGIGGTTAAAHADAAVVTLPSMVIVEHEPVLYHGLAGATFSDIVRDDPIAHAGGVLVGALVDLSVDGVSGFPGTGGRLRIGNEVLTYTATAAGPKLTGVLRGVDGTPIEAHAVAALVTLEAYTLQRTNGVVRPVPLTLQNTGSGALAAGVMVNWRASPGAGGGVEAAQEGEPIVGITAEAIAEDAWGRLRGGGVASMTLVTTALFPGRSVPSPGEPVFCYDGTHVKAVADAVPGDEAVGWCLAVHTKSPSGAVLADPRVDFRMVSRFSLSYVEP